MEVNLPEPIGSVELYTLYRRLQRYTSSGLEDLLAGTERDLDALVKRLWASEDIVIVEYHLMLWTSPEMETYLGDFIAGGFDLSVPEGRRHSLGDWQESYKRSFGRAREAYRTEPVQVDFEVTGFRDKISHAVEAEDPEEPRTQN